MKTTLRSSNNLRTFFFVFSNSSSSDFSIRASFAIEAELNRINPIKDLHSDARSRGRIFVIMLSAYLRRFYHPSIEINMCIISVNLHLDHDYQTLLSC